MRQNNTRMDNEQLYISLAYLDHKARRLKDSTSGMFEVIDFYQKGRNINVRIKAKNELTNLLNELTENPSVKEDFRQSLKNTERFIARVKALLLESDIYDEKQLVAFLNDSLNQLLDLKDKSGVKRTYQAIYLLWFILYKINVEMVRRNKAALRAEITSLMRFVKDTSALAENGPAMDTFKNLANRIWNLYPPAPRVLELSVQQKQELIVAQGNVCPLCALALHWGEPLHIDHRIPIAAGGPDTIDNLQATHEECNLKKGVRFRAEDLPV